VIINLQFRSDTYARLAVRATPLKAGEPGYETDTHRLRVGDGVHLFADLPVVAADITALTTLTQQAVDAAAAAQQSADDAAASAGGVTGATDTTAGVVRLATTAEATAGTDDTIAVTPAGLEAATAGLTGNPPSASTTAQGVVELATTTEAQTGTDNVRAVTPAGVAAAITALGVSTPDATTAVKGKVQLATGAEAIAGTDAVKAITPATAKSAIDARVASTSAKGLVQLATTTEATTGTDNTKAVTPAGVAAVAAGLSTVKVANISDASPAGRALLLAADVPAQLTALSLTDVARQDQDNDFTGTNTFPPGSIDPAALGALDQIISDYNLANRVVSFRTYAFGTTPAITPNTLWGELASGATPTPSDTLVTHQGSTVDGTDFSFDPGAMAAAAVYTLVVTSGDSTGTATAPSKLPTSIAGRSLTWAPIMENSRHVTDAVTNGTTTLTSATANFQAADVGKIVTGDRIPAGTYITARASTTSVTLSQAASGSGTGGILDIGGAHTSAGTMGIMSYRGTGTPDSTGNIAVHFPATVQGCHIELLATSSVNATPVDAAYNGQASGFAAPTVDLGNAPTTGDHQLAAVSWNSGSSTINTDPGTPFGTSPNVSTSSPSMQSRMSVLAAVSQVVTWAKSDSSQPLTFTVVYHPA
jgi:hypothetical protein